MEVKIFTKIVCQELSQKHVFEMNTFKNAEKSWAKLGSFKYVLTFVKIVNYKF